MSGTSNPGPTVEIRPLGVSTRRDEAAEQLRSLIENHHFKPGDRLPSERDLGERMGVSRTVVREAISILEAVGLIEVRHGSGSYVTGTIPERNLSTMWKIWYDIHHHDLIHLLQVREALEVKAAELALSNDNPDLLDQLGKILDATKKAVLQDDLQKFVLLDLAFHGAITAASGNPIFVQLLSSLNSVLKNDRIAVLRLPERLVRSLDEHSAIWKAFERHDLQGVRSAYRTHFRNVINDIRMETE